PEQARGRSADWRSDIYSLGVVAFELFLGQPPFGAGSELEVLTQHLSKAPPRPSSLWPDVPRPLEKLLLQMLAKEAGGRRWLAEVHAPVSAVLLGLRGRAVDEAAATTPVGALPPVVPVQYLGPAAELELPPRTDPELEAGGRRRVVALGLVALALLLVAV